ncbi:MAG: DsbA family protein [Oceanicaulis sp.]
MRVLAALAVSIALAACSGETDASAQGEPDGALDRARVEEIVRSYILDNPEIIEEALIELQRRAREQEQDQITGAVTANADRLTGDARNPVAGAENPKVTVVEFFDYRCPYCTVTNEWIQDVLEEHGDEVQVVFKEFPVRGAQSEEAARAALAVWNLEPEAYLPFHNALITATGPLPSARIDDLAREAGVDPQAMREQMDSDAVTGHLADIRDLATEIGVRGTPFFVVGDQVIPGADMAALQRALDEELAG